MNKKVTLNDLFPIIDEQLNAGGCATFTIHGNSMEPLLRNKKSTVKIEKASRPLKKYDIIFYRRDDGSFILHRIVGIKKDGYICRGDNQTINEYPVNAESIIGIVTEYGIGEERISVNSVRQKIYAVLRVNTVWILRIFSIFKKN